MLSDQQSIEATSIAINLSGEIFFYFIIIFFNVLKKAFLLQKTPFF
jgi:hypothetical protein